MPILPILITLIIVGVLVWLVNTYIPMAEPWKKFFNIVAIVLTAIWLLNVFGAFAYLGNARVGHY